MVDFSLDWQYIPDAKAVFDRVGNKVKRIMRDYEMRDYEMRAIAPSAIASDQENAQENAKWWEIYERYLKEKSDIDWEWLELERKAQALNVQAVIESVRQQQGQVELERIQLDPQQQQHPEIVELHKAALYLKKSELWQQQHQCEQHLNVMFLLQEKQVKRKLQELEEIKDWEHSRSPQSRTAIHNLCLYGQDVLLLYGQIYYQVLVLVAPPAIADDPDIPQKLRGNLPLDLEDNIQEFLGEHYSIDLNAPVKCYGNYFNEPISDWRVQELFHLLQPMTTIVLYPKLKEKTLTFQVGYWGIYGEVKKVEFAPHFTLNWPELLAAFQQQGLEEKQTIRLLRHTIVDLHRLVAAYLVDLHYLAIDAFAVYQPRLLELKTEFNLVAPQWTYCVEILREVQALRQEIYQRWHRQQEQIRELEKRRQQQKERQQIDRWCCLKTLWENEDSGWVNAVAYSPDGRTLAAGYFDHTIKLWALTRSRYSYPFTRTLEGHVDCVNTIAYSPDGKTLASGGRDCMTKLWNVATGQCIRTLEGHTEQVQAVVYSPDSHTLASGSNDKTIKLWDVQTGICLRTLQGDRASILSLAYSLDGRTLVSGNNRGSIQLWNVATGECFQEFRSAGSVSAHFSSVWSVAYSPDGGALASASEDKAIRLWNSVTGECFAILQGHSKSVKLVAFSPDGYTLASASCDNTVKLWNIETKRCYRRLEGHAHVVNSVAYSPDGNVLASGSYDGSIKLWGFPINQE